jgi:hypothetical protein
MPASLLLLAHREKRAESESDMGSLDMMQCFLAQQHKQETRGQGQALRHWRESKLLYHAVQTTKPIVS